jgi:hypothetical protein
LVSVEQQHRVLGQPKTRVVTVLFSGPQAVEAVEAVLQDLLVQDNSGDLVRLVV